MIRAAIDDLRDLDVLAGAVASAMQTGDIVELHGHMGAGKTTLVGCVARALGIREPVRSPTYAVAHAYATPDGSSRLAHVDCWRDSDAPMGAAAFADIEALIEDATWTFVEWPEALAPWLAHRRRWVIRIDAADLDRRDVEIVAPDTDSSRALASAIAGLIRTDR